MKHRSIRTNSYNHWCWQLEDYSTHKKARYTEQKQEMCREAINELCEELEALKIILKSKESL